jgi:hypothetical protein
MTKLTKEHILSEIRRTAAENGGVPIGQEKFPEVTGIQRKDWLGKHWAKWGDAVREAGFEPNQLQGRANEDELLTHLARLTRELGKFPSTNDIKLKAREEPGFPWHNTFDKLGNTRAKATRLLQFCKERRDTDIAAICAEFLTRKSPPPRQPKQVAPTPQAATAGQVVQAPQAASPPLTSYSESLLPPAIACLSEIVTRSIASAGQGSGRDTSDELEFERRTGLAFRLMGLETRQLGQGTGRQADGVASCPEHGWAIIYDAKLRQGAYRIGTEDRKFREYIEHHQPALARTGISKLYFVIVSGTFVESDVNNAREIVRLTSAKSVVMLSIEALLRIVELRLSNSHQFDQRWLERQFLETRVLTVALIPEVPDTGIR